MVTMRMTSLFFDAPAVRRAVDAAKRRELSRAGAFIRQRAKTSIRQRKGISRPGDPPHSHAGDLRRLIFFAWDRVSDSVVVGPLPFKAGEAPSLLEFGGRAVRADRRGKRRRVRYRKRPFMGPALEAELPQLPARFRNSVRGGRW